VDVVDARELLQNLGQLLVPHALRELHLWAWRAWRRRCAWREGRDRVRGGGQRRRARGERLRRGGRWASARVCGKGCGGWRPARRGAAQRGKRRARHAPCACKTSGCA
jgi:hypothetical protein